MADENKKYPEGFVPDDASAQTASQPVALEGFVPDDASALVPQAQPKESILQSAANEFMRRFGTKNDPEAAAALQSLAYPGQVLGTYITSASPLALGLKKLAGQHDVLATGYNEIKKAIGGEATPLNEQIEKGYGVNPLISKILGFGVGAASDPYANIGKLGSVEALESLANKATIRHLRPPPSVYRAVEQSVPGGMTGVAQEVRRSGAMKPFATAEQTSARLEPLIEEAGNKMGEIISSSPKTISPLDVANKIRSEVIDPLRGPTANIPLVKSLEEKLQAFLENHAPGYSPHGNPEVPEMTMPTLSAEKRAEQDWGKYSNPNQPLPPLKAQRDWASTLKKIEDELANNPEAFKRLKETFGRLSAAQGMTNRTEALTNGGTGLVGSLLDLGVGLEAAKKLTEGSAAGVPLVVAKTLAKGKTSSTAANAFGGMSNLAQKLGNPKLDAILRNQIIQQAAPRTGGIFGKN